MRRAASVSLVCSRVNEGCSISEPANSSASHSRPGAKRRDSTDVGIEGEAEQHQHHQHEDQRGGQQFARAELRLRSSLSSRIAVGRARAIQASLLARRGPSPACAADRRTAAESSATRPASRRTARVTMACASLAPCVLIRIVQPRVVDARQRLAEPVLAGGIEAGGGLVEAAAGRDRRAARGRWPGAGACRGRSCAPDRRARRGQARWFERRCGARLRERSRP